MFDVFFNNYIDKLFLRIYKNIYFKKTKFVLNVYYINLKITNSRWEDKNSEKFAWIKIFIIYLSFF